MRPEGPRQAGAQTGWAVGWSAAAIVYYRALLDAAGIHRLAGAVQDRPLPAVFVFWVRRHIDEPEIFKERAADRAQIVTSHLFAAFRGRRAGRRLCAEHLDADLSADGARLVPRRLE